MKTIEALITSINGLVWGPPMLVMTPGVGLFLSIGLKLMPVLKLGAGFRLMWKGSTGKESEGGMIWLEADTLNARMARPNLIALLLLSPAVFHLTREHFEKRKAAGG